MKSSPLRHLAVLILLAGWASASACGPSSERTSGGSQGGGTGAKGSKENSGKGEGSSSEAPPKETGSGPQSGSGSAAGAIDEAPETGVPPYQYTRAEIRAILKSPIASFTKDPNAPADIQRAKGYGDLEKFFGKYLEEIPRIARFKELVDISVAVKDSDELNAFADAWRRITITRFAISSGAGASLSATICHEIGHLLRDHPSHYSADSFPEDIIDALNAYWTGTYDETGKKYRHDKDKYKTFRDGLETSRRKIATTLKRHESEADLIGAWLCMQIGFSFDEVYDDFAYYERYDVENDSVKALAAADPLNWEDGEYEVEDPSVFLYQTLWPMDSHPTSSERAKQLIRVRPALDPQDGEIDAGPAKLWRAEYPGLRQAVPGGLTLTDVAPARRVIARKVGTGEAVYAPKTGCR